MAGLAVVVTPGVGEKLPDDAGGPIEFRGQSKERVHVLNTGERVSVGVKNSNGVIDGFNHESATFAESLVWRFKTELVSTICETLIDMAQSIEAQKAARLGGDDHVALDDRLWQRKREAGRGSAQH